MQPAQYGEEKTQVRTLKSVFNTDNAIYILFTLETTGLNNKRREIIEFSCQLVTYDGSSVRSGMYQSLVHLQN
jgi:DNA polymerase III alpha subunit (gram-positive type)